ncbi:transcriptional regulator [Arthrobacter sp. AQ5-05]|nr:transcriptional regulator [Arthrobacter sp. AQ5-05]
MTLVELGERVGIGVVNLSILKNNRARAMRFSTLQAICRALDCEAGELLSYAPAWWQADGRLPTLSRWRCGTTS